MNIDAMLSQTKHVQFVTFHREDANQVIFYSCRSLYLFIFKLLIWYSLTNPIFVFTISNISKVDWKVWVLTLKNDWTLVLFFIPSIVLPGCRNWKAAWNNQFLPRGVLFPWLRNRRVNPTCQTCQRWIHNLLQVLQYTKIYRELHKKHGIWKKSPEHKCSKNKWEA